MSRFFIERPVLSNVIAIVTILLGAVCLYTLPVAQYPQIVPPTIQVTASYAGASADRVANTIGIPIEQAVNGVENSIYMQSTSGSDGSYTLTITFAVGTEPQHLPCLWSRTRSTAALPQLPQASPLAGGQCPQGQHQYPADREPLFGRQSLQYDTYPEQLRDYQFAEPDRAPAGSRPGVSALAPALTACECGSIPTS